MAIRQHERKASGHYGEGNPKYKKTFASEVLELVEQGLVTTIIDIAHHFKTDRFVVDDWCKRYPEFDHAIVVAKEAFQNNLVKHLASGGAPAGCIFLLKCNYGFIEGDRRKELELRETELNAKLAGKIGNEANASLSINFIDSQPPAPVETPLLPEG